MTLNFDRKVDIEVEVDFDISPPPAQRSAISQL